MSFFLFMILPTKRRKLIEALKEADKEWKGTSQGGSIIKKFIGEALKDLDEVIKTERRNLENVSGVRVLKIWS